MAPSKIEEASQTNLPPSDNSGVLTPNSAAHQQWTPQAVLSTLPDPYPTNPTTPIPFFHLLERLKTTKREGWRRFGIDHGESIADHMYRMSIMTLLCPATLSRTLDLPRCTRMALVHDMAESLVGDITPVDGVTKTEKSRRETDTMDYICSSLLGSLPGQTNAHARDQIRAAWQEYEDSRTPESHFVHDVDKIELLLQMVEYERAHQGPTTTDDKNTPGLDLGEFSRVAGKIALPEMQTWAEEILQERRRFWEGKGVVPSHMNDVSEGKRKAQDAYYEGSGKAVKVDGEKEDARNGEAS
ncbi:hypothetical protein D0862_06297 [Hortaea werneckii]|uniref:5'-deoxynucleotidase n=1 Tax=Hortaea werneckii TaxID=91943 RepID=A0A3M7GKP2_HORWE|nr:hypothetical protein D0862_06297 [Hortaea werneckii]